MDREPEVSAALAAVAGGEDAESLESPTLDFKEDRGSAKATVKLAVDATLCFANAAGGAIVLGVRDKGGGTAAFSGTSWDPDDLRRRIYDSTRPPVLVEVERRRVHGVDLLIISVPSGPDVHSDAQGRAPRRLGTDCRPMSVAEQTQLRDDRARVDWSSRLSDRPFSDLDDKAIDAARQRLRAFTDSRRRLADLTVPDLLRVLGVLDAEGILLNAAEVLFCSPADPSRPAIVYQYRATPAGEPRAIERLQPPLLLAYSTTLDLVRARQDTTALTLPNGQQIQLEDFPELAVREALTNAVVHRDYRVTGAVAIEHSPSLLAVVSPGPLVAGITPENILTHPSKPRNNALAAAARTLGMAEETGLGVDRMYREMIRSGRDVPTIEAPYDSVRVVFAGGSPNTSIARYVAQLPADEQDDTDALLVLLQLCGRQSVNTTRMAPVLQKSKAETEAVLRRLALEPVGMIEPTRSTASRTHPNYRLRGDVLKVLGASLPYQRRTVDEIDRKIIAHVREYGRITNATVQNLLDVKVTRASQILKDLVDRQILVKTTQQQRGPGVEYGPGSVFGSKKSKPADAKSQDLQLSIEELADEDQQ